ncbi:hypothetical protein V9T40_004608 [Parthenolecanium corni]|uniref:Uncharacterized protein n=1 Tax=Parthenolecanium corni TaxID=536013 RepID=A0AAN9TSP9_9HEMI
MKNACAKTTTAAAAAAAAAWSLHSRREFGRQFERTSGELLKGDAPVSSGRSRSHRVEDTKRRATTSHRSGGVGSRVAANAERRGGGGEARLRRDASSRVVKKRQRSAPRRLVASGVRPAAGVMEIMARVRGSRPTRNEKLLAGPARNCVVPPLATRRTKRDRPTDAVNVARF